MGRREPVLEAKFLCASSWNRMRESHCFHAPGAEDKLSSRIRFQNRVALRYRNEASGHFRSTE